MPYIINGSGKNKTLLEMFKGTGSVGKVAKKFNYNIVSIDLDPIFTPTIETDILEWDYKKFQKDNNFKPNFIWASPPCNTFSPLAYPFKERNIENAKPKSERAKIGTKILYKTLEIINYFKKLNPDLKFVIENPRGMMRKDLLMKKLHRETTLYCLYGDFKRKATDFWSNFDMELKNPEEYKCNSKNLIGVVDLPLEKRYSIPSKLIKQIFEMANKNDIISDDKMGSGKDKFIKQLEDVNYPVEKYIKDAKKEALKEGYDPNKLSYAYNNDNKLKYESPEGIKYFGKAGYGDFLIWSLKEKRNEVKKGYANMKRNIFRKSHGEITKMYNLDKFSPNELAIKILW